MGGSDGNINEFMAHPDYQQISAFFLGAVFISSLNYSFLWIRGFFPRVKKWFHNRYSTRDLVENISVEKNSLEPSLEFIRPGDNQSLVFALSLCFFFTSIAFFGSLLSFNSNGGATCAFLLGSGGMAAQTARLVGLVILLLEMRNLGIFKVEFYITSICLFFAMVLVFVNNAISTGSVKMFDPLGSGLCYKKRFLATAIATSVIYLLVELFILLRLALMLTREVTTASRLRTTLGDRRVAKTLSLILLELLTIGPSAIRISLLADFIPLSIGALVVLVAFNHNSQDTVPMLDPNSMSPISVVPSLRQGWQSHRSFASSYNTHDNRMTAASFPNLSPAKLEATSYPFSTKYISDATRSWSRQQKGVSIAETTMSEGVIQTVQHSGNPPRARAFFVSSDDLAPPLPKKSTMYPPVPPVAPLPTALSTPTTAETPELPLQVPTPTFTASSPFSAASILMHPWHAERKRRTRSVQLKSRFSTDVSDIDETGSETKSPTSSSRGSARNSYMSDMSVPPLPPLIGPVQRYSSATLTSPAVSQHSREGQPRYKVRLLAFESNFRTGRTSSPAISAMS